MSDSRDELPPDEDWSADSEGEASPDEAPEPPAESSTETNESDGQNAEPQAGQATRPAKRTRSGGNGSARRHRRRRKSNDQHPEDDERASLALAFTTDVVQGMGLSCRVRLRRPKDEESSNEINIEITGRDAGRIIGKKGQVLSALQFLVHRVVNRPGLERRHILVDAEGYRSRRDSSLATMARRLTRGRSSSGKRISTSRFCSPDRLQNSRFLSSLLNVLYLFKISSLALSC